MRNPTILLAAVLIFSGIPVLTAHAQLPLSANLRGSGTISLPGGTEQAVTVVRLRMESSHRVRLVVEGADLPPTEFSGKWSGPVENRYTLILDRALEGIKAQASGRVYLRGPKAIDRITLRGKAQTQDFSLEFLPTRRPVLAFKELSLTGNGTGFLKMPDSTRESLNQIAVTLSKNGNATIQVTGETDATFGGKWAHVGNSELIRLVITSGFNNAGGTGSGTLTMRSATEIENIYFTSKASEGVVYSVRFTTAASPPAVIVKLPVTVIAPPKTPIDQEAAIAPP